MVESLNPEMEKVGVKLIWAGTNQEESKIFKIVHMVDASQRNFVTTRYIQSSLKLVLLWQVLL